MWNRPRFIRFLQVSQIFQRRKSDANKQDFENKLNLTCHAQSTPKTTRILTKLFSTSDPNLVALAWKGDELSHGQAQNGVNFDFEVKFDLESHGQSPPKTIGILTKVFYTYGPHLVILAWTGYELSCGQTWWRTDGLTDGRTQATTILASGKKMVLQTSPVVVLEKIKGPAHMLVEGHHHLRKRPQHPPTHSCKMWMKESEITWQMNEIDNTYAILWYMVNLKQKNIAKKFEQGFYTCAKI